MNELLQMKNQMSQLMQSLKEKEEIINQQNMKLGHMGPGIAGFNNFAAAPVGMGANMNGMNNMNGINGMNPMSSINGMNSIPPSSGFLSAPMMQ